MPSESVIVRVIVPIVTSALDKSEIFSVELAAVPPRVMKVAPVDVLIE